MDATLTIENLKCEGCIASIRTALQQLPGVERVTVRIEDETVRIEGPEPLPLDPVRATLHKLGYPEKGMAQGFDRFQSKARSVVSCMVGKLSQT